MAKLPLFKQRLSGGPYEPFYTARGPKFADTAIDPDCCLCCDCLSVNKVKVVIQGWNQKECQNPFCDDIFENWMIGGTINKGWTTTDVAATQFGNACTISAEFHLGERQDDIDPGEEPALGESGVLMREWFAGGTDDCMSYPGVGQNHRTYLYHISASMACTICPSTGKAILCGFGMSFGCQNFTRTAERPFTEPEEELGELIFGLWEDDGGVSCSIPMTMYDSCMTSTRSDPQVCPSPVLPPVATATGCDEISSLLGGCAGAHGNGPCFGTFCNWDFEEEDEWFRFSDVVTLMCVIGIDED